MQSISFSEIVRALKEAGLKPGDIVNVHCRLFTIGRILDTPAYEIPENYLHAFREVIGDQGTIVVPTGTTSFGRFGTPFVLEESPSEFGVFSEHIRKSPGAVRSLHPIQSLTALGQDAQELANDHPRWNVGHDTIWDRMLQKGGKVVTLGIAPRHCLTFVHQAECLACVPYMYNKILRGEVFARGERIPDDFFIAVRYLEYGIGFDLSRLEDELAARSAITQIPLGGDNVWVTPMESVFETVLKGLRHDPYYLLRDVPTFVDGQIPLDGTTIQREGAAPNYFLPG
ncbi:MAG: AAC(3) family N-acetyltransferase [Chloroflexi bacterium]|nr:AAC(3) family N-acetyltransferase [Chloroflexota bacterium]